MSDVMPLSDNTEAKHSNLRPWRPGESGNLAGRPKGSRNRIAEAFLSDLLEDWREHGPEAIRRVRTDDPSTYVKVVAATLPRELDVSVSAFADVSSVVEAFRIATAIVGSDVESLRKHAPHLIEHDDSP